MPLINQSLPNLVQGVSQQPPVNRFEGQAEEQVNAISSVVDGLSKRPNTRHLGELLTTAISSDSFVHFIDRSENEKYVAIHDGTSLKAWNLDGTACTINGASQFTPPTSSYLNTGIPSTNLKALTVGDTTFLLNKTKPVVASTNLTDDIEKTAVVTITQGDYKKNYRVDAEVYPLAAQQSGFVAPTFNIVYEDYFYSSDGYSSGSGIINNAYYRWRVASITTTNAGSGLTTAPTITITSNLDTYTSASFTVNINNGSVVGNPTINNAGSYEGSGVQQVQGGTVSLYHHGRSQPTFTETIDTGVGSSTNLFAFIQSGSSANSANENANSDRIANDLQGKMVESVSGGTSGSWASHFNKTYNTNSNNIYLTLSDTTDVLKISTTDSLSNTGMSVAYQEVDAISNLPVENKNGFKIKVRGAADLNEDDYYVEFETAQGKLYGDGVYNETVGFKISEGFTNTSAPHILKLTAPNTFTFGEGDYANRIAGDDNTNPHPSFTGTEINNIFFFKNRLGFLCQDKVILSEAGEPFNFYRTTVTTLLDSDPIDVQVSSQKVTNLKSAVGFQENLILFSENSQFVLKGGEMLTPKTVSVTPVTNFDASSKVNPVPLGAYMYFPVEGTNFSSIREYTVNASTDVYDSTDITEHVPAYIPSNVTLFAGTSTKDALALVSPDEPSSIFVYRYFFNGQKKLLSSWFKFVLDGEIRGLSFSKSDLYIVVAYNNTTQLVRMPFNENLKDKDDAPVDLPNSEHATYLDFRTLLTVAQGDTSVALPYDLPTGTLQCYTGDGAQISGSNNSTHFNFSSAITADQAGKIWIGKPFTMTYVFSELIFKDQAGSGKSASNSSKMMLKNGTIFYDNTKGFTVQVEPSGKPDRDTQTDIFSADAVDSTILGQTVGLQTGSFRFPIFSDATDTKITVTDDSIFNVQLTSAEFEGLVKPRSKRIG